MRVSGRYTGAGISEDIINRGARDEMPGNKIGLLNVHHRVKLLSGQGLTIIRHQPGTEIAFTLSKSEPRLAAPLSPITEPTT